MLLSVQDWCFLYKLRVELDSKYAQEYLIRKGNWWKKCHILTVSKASTSFCYLLWNIIWELLYSDKASRAQLNGNLSVSVKAYNNINEGESHFIAKIYLSFELVMKVLFFEEDTLKANLKLLWNKEHYDRLLYKAVAIERMWVGLLRRYLIS